MKHYILDKNGEPVPATLEKWAEWYEKDIPLSKRRVASDWIGSVHVSTVFLSIDHNYSRTGPPILWETMIFGGKHDQYQTRCSGSREQAEAMHAKAVALVKEKKSKEKQRQ